MNIILLADIIYTRDSLIKTIIQYVFHAKK